MAVEQSWIRNLYGGQDPDMPFSSAECKQWAAAFPQFYPKVDAIKGTVLVTGTGGEMDTGELQELFNNPEAYKLKREP